MDHTQGMVDQAAPVGRMIGKVASGDWTDEDMVVLMEEGEVSQWQCFRPDQEGLRWWRHGDP